MYIISILTYTGEAWAPFISTSIWRKIEAVQTIGIRVILGQPSIVKTHYFFTQPVSSLSSF
jgi:hypothetical protein